jgi:hypothetical protein
VDQQPTSFGRLPSPPGLRVDLVRDPHLAAMVIELGLTLCSTGGDFAPCPGLRWQKSSCHLSHPRNAEKGGAAARRAAPYCIVDLVVGTIRVTTIAARSRQFITRGDMSFFQWSLS